MTKQQAKRLAALVLALAMTLSTLSLPVCAADVSEGVPDASDAVVVAETGEPESSSAEDTDEAAEEEAENTSEEAAAPEEEPDEEETVTALATGSFDAVIEGIAFDSSSTWDEQGVADLSLTTEDTPTDGVTLTLSLLIAADSAAFSGLMKAVGVLRVGDSWTWVQSNTIPELSADSFDETVTIDGVSYRKATVNIPFSGTVGANDADGNWDSGMAFDKAVADAVSAVTVKVAGYQCDYSGSIYIQDAQLVEVETTPSTETAISWDFEDGIDGWYYNSGWNSSYDGEGSVSHAEGMLQVFVDYSANSNASWSQTAISYSTSEGMDLSGVNALTMDFYYDPNAKTTGSLKVKAYADYGINVDLAVDESSAEDVTVDGKAMKKVSLTFSFDALTETAATDFSIALIGSMTDYSGSLYLDNVAFTKSSTEEDIYVNSTVALDDKTNLSVSGNTLTSQTEDGSDETTSIATSVTLVDGNATEETAKVYALLQALGNSDSMIFGHQNDTWHKTGSSSLSASDVEDVTQSISGVVGIDTLSMVGNEYSAERYNNEHDDAEIDIDALGEARANVKAAAELTNENIEAGAIITLSAHMPNFSKVALNESYNEETDPTYAKYDFSGYTPNDLTGDVVNKILPGGEYNEVYNAFLDMIADYASQVDGVILFRPFHENTGSWFWWGAAFCDAETYKNVYRYTVEYLRDEKGVHNFLYEYGPSSEASNEAEYEERYPGDNYVDIIGFDMYNSDPQEDNSAWMTSFQTELALVEGFAKKHNKLLAVTETGVANTTSSEAALLKSGNKDQTWFEEVADIVSQSSASYFLVWANFGIDSGFYTPYVVSVNEDGTLYGHELLDSFLTFFNDGRSVFAGNLKGILAQMPTVSAEAVTTAATGYFTSPVSGSRILQETTITAKLTGASDETVAEIVLHGDGVDVTLPMTTKDGSYYSAVLDADTLASLGEYVGTIELLIDGERANSISIIFNTEEPEEDPYQIDDFENYSGVDSLLTKSWATNKATGSTITLSLTQEEGKVFSGEYAMSFTYHETSDGWAGATISKEVDWSDCNALQFYTIPDGNNQKVVIQITANGVVYETYLNLYEAYANTTEPHIVTIPFSEFCQRDTAGNPTGGLVDDCSSVTSFGLWVNAIAGSDAISEDGTVSGTIYYDNITAVSTDLTEATFTPVTQEETVDTSALTAAIEQAEALNEIDYTIDSWAALQTALTNAKTVAADIAATQTEVDEAANAVTAAISALEQAEEALTAPAATKITSLVNKAKGVKATWEAVDNATSYQVYRKISSGNWKKVKTTTSTSWTDAAATKNGTKYQYKVYAVNSAGKSSASATETIYRLTAKRFTRAKNVSSRKISLKWTRNTKATGYIIEFSTSSDFSNTKTVKVKGDKNLTTTLKNLKKGKTYYIRMRPYKTSGSVTSYAGWSKVKTVKVKK